MINICVQHSGPSFNRPSICRRPDNHNTCFFPFFTLFLERSFFPSIFLYHHCRFLLYGVYAVPSFLPDGVFYLVTTGWIFDVSLCENSDIKKHYNGGLLPDIKLVLLTLCDYIIRETLQPMVPPKHFG